MSLAIEATIIAAWIIGLASARPVRDLVRAAPRVPLALLGAVFALWIGVQLRKDLTRFFPVISWMMYGEERPPGPVDGVRVDGLRCEGGTVFLDPGGLFPDRGFRNRVRGLYLRFAAARTATDTATRARQLDTMLVRLGRRHNAISPASRVCGVRVSVYRIPPEAVGRTPLPAAVPVRDVALD